MKKTLLAGAAIAAAVTMTRAHEPPEGVTWSRGQPPPASGQRFASFTGGSYDEATRTCDAVFATGAEVRRWYGTEKLEISEEAIDLSRVALNQVRLLFSHDSKQPIGVVLTASIQGGALAGKVQFADTDEGRKYGGMVQRGELTGISVGYNVTQWTRVQDLEHETDEWTATRWELMEVSLVAVPADPLAGVRSAEPTPGAPPIADPGAGQRSNEENRDMLTIAQVLALGAQARALGLTEEAANAILSREGITHAQAMEEILAQATAARSAAATAAAAVIAAAPATAVAPVAEVRAAAPATPTPAVVEARSLTVAEGLQLRSQAIGLGVAEAVADEVVQRAGITREQASAAIMEAAANANRSAVAPVPAGSAARVTVDATETQRTHMEEALFARMSSTKPTDGARRFMGWSMMHMWAERAGINERDPVTIYEIVSDRRSAMSTRQGAMMTSSDFPLLLEAAANKTLKAAYELQAPTYRRWARKITFKDFKPHNFYRVGEFPKLLPLGEAGEIKAGTFKESKESAKLSTSGRLVMVTRPMLVNDDLGAFGEWAAGAGRAVSRRENEVAYTYLLQNNGAGPRMADNKFMFHVDHANLGTTGIPSETTLDEMQQIALAQVDLDGNELNTEFPILLAGAKNKLIIKKLLVAVTPTRTEDVNVHSGDFTPVYDAKIKNKAWYNLGNPETGESNFLYGYLGDREGPMLREDKPFNYDGMGFGLVHDFGFGADDYRFAAYNAGE